MTPSLLLLEDLQSVARSKMSAIATGSAKNAVFAVQLHAMKLRDGAPHALKFNALGSTSLIAGCEWWCRAVNAGKAQPTATQCLAALELPRADMSALLLIEDAWLALLAQCAASDEV